MNKVMKLHYAVV